MEIPKIFKKKNEKQRESEENLRIAKEFMRRGSRFAKEKKIDTFLPLSGNDQTVLYLSISLKLLNRQIEESKFSLLGYSPATGGFYGHKKDTDKTARLKQEFDILQRTIELFINKYYPNSTSRARNIGLAVTNLFAQTDYMNISQGKTNQTWTPKVVQAWAEEWKPKILASPQEPRTIQSD